MKLKWYRITVQVPSGG